MPLTSEQIKALSELQGRQMTERSALGLEQQSARDEMLTRQRTETLALLESLGIPSPEVAPELPGMTEANPGGVPNAIPPEVPPGAVVPVGVHGLPGYPLPSLPQQYPVVRRVNMPRPLKARK
jgi:hypothetical protein